MHIVLGLQVGGLEKFVINLASAYQANVFSVIVCLEQSGALGRESNAVEVVELRKPSGIAPSTVMRICSLVRTFKIDIIHTHNPSPHFYGVLAGLLTRKPIIHTKHGRNNPNDSRKVLLNRILASLTDKVVAVSEDASEICTSIEKVSEGKVSVILNGVDTTVFKSDADIKLKRKEVKIGIVARLSEEKDHSTLLQACKIMKDRQVPFTLDIIGDGPLAHSLLEQVSALEIGSSVNFMGMRNDIPSIMRELDIFTLSSTTEGISLTLLEAMATELPVVATKVGGNPEVVVEGETGLLVPSREPAALADSLSALVKNESLRCEMGRRGRSRVVNHFSMMEVARKYEDLYRSVLKSDKR